MLQSDVYWLFTQHFYSYIKFHGMACYGAKPVSRLYIHTNNTIFRNWIKNISLLCIYDVKMTWQFLAKICYCMCNFNPWIKVLYKYETNTIKHRKAWWQQDSAHHFLHVRSEVPTAVFLKIQVFWNVTLCHWIHSSSAPVKHLTLQLQDRAYQEVCLILKSKALCLSIYA